MNDQLLSQLTGIPLRQIQSYNPQQKQQVIEMAKKSPKWDAFQDNVNRNSMETSSKSMENLGYTPGLNGWTKTFNSNYKFEKPKPIRQPIRQPRQLTDQEIQEEVALTKKLNPTYQYEHFASTKDPNRVGVKVTNPVTGEVAEYGASYVDMYGNEIKNPSWEYMGKGALGEGQSWRKVAGNMRVNGRQVDSSNKPIHFSASSYPESKQEKQTPKVETRQKQSSEVPSSVVATINRTAARFPGGGGGYSANGNRNGKAFFGLADSDALVNLAGDAWNATKGFMSKVGDYLSGPDKPIQTNTPTYGRRNLIMEGMQKVHSTFGNTDPKNAPIPDTYGGGKMGGGGAGSIFYSTPEYEEIQEKEKLLVPITQTWNRDQAFAQARKEGKKTFWFDGKEYTTEMGNKPASAANHIETRTIGILPIEYNKKRKILKEENK